MMTLPDFPRLPRPAAAEPFDEPDADETAAPRDDPGRETASGDGTRTADQAGVPPPREAANSYRFAGLVTLIPEDSASVDRRA